MVRVDGERLMILKKIKELDVIKFEKCKKNNIKLIYFAKKQDKSYITDDIIYKDLIYFDIKRFNEMYNKEQIIEKFAIYMVVNMIIKK